MFNIPHAAFEVLLMLDQAGFEAVIAGGWVRDMLLGLPSNDIDIATNATPTDLEKIFDNIKFVGKDFGVALIKHFDMEFEVATFRKDGEYLDGRHPSSVKFCDMEEDAKRRDLTMNALFYDPFDKKVIDFVNGQQDIEDKICRFVGNAEKRIQEDHIRMLRAIRFSNRFAFKLDKDAIYWIRGLGWKLKDSPKERISLEMNKILEQCNADVFDLLKYSSLLEFILPELLPMIGCEQPPEFHPEGDVWVHTMMAFDEVKKLEPSLELLWATLLHDVGKPPVQFWDESSKRFRFNKHDKVSVSMTRDILTRLKFANHFQDRVCELIGNHMKFGEVHKMRTAKVKRFVFMPNFDDHIKLHTADCISSHGKLDNIDFCKNKIDEFLTEQPKAEMPKPIITGYDLLQYGMKPGPKFKEILDKCMDAQLENEITEDTDVMKYLNDNFSLEIMETKPN